MFPSSYPSNAPSIRDRRFPLNSSNVSSMSSSTNDTPLAGVVGTCTKLPYLQGSAEDRSAISCPHSSVLAHYLPQMYLTRFTRNDRLAVYDRATGKLRVDKTRNVAAISNFYILTSKGKPDDSVEAGILANVEAQASPILDAVCAGAAPSRHQRRVLAKFLALLCRRVPFFADAHAGLNQSLARMMFRRVAGTPELAAKFISRRKRFKRFSPDRFAEFVNSDALTFPPNQNERIQMMLDMAEPLTQAFDEMRWTLLRTNDAARFITSDSPVGFSPLSGAMATYGEQSRNVLKFIALSPTVCLRLSDPSTEKGIADEELSAIDVSRVNSFIANAATRLVIAQEEGDLKSVLDATGLRDSSFIPTTGIVEWYDASGNRSFTPTVRVHHNTSFPLRLPVTWRCCTCGYIAITPFFVTSDLTAAQPREYTRWLDAPCRSCGVSPRENGSSLAGRRPSNLVPPEDE
jgi:hypothetical protein